ncbi:MAG: hydroxymethylbilane synthase [Lachnospiraceae bacterium]|nr:hydroxymethylbilane synthase [Lachnospiraceae bacterium]
MKLRIGTRKSKLAMVQTEIVRDAILAHFPEIEIEIIPMSTKGDRLLDRSLTSFGGKGVFTKELEEALLKGQIDLAVHSAKDMPMEFPKGLTLGAVLAREDAADVLVTRTGIPARQLPAGSVVGTSSLRRQLQIHALNPQVRIRQLRGNVQTRLEKLRRGEYDGILLAAAGLHRLELLNPEGLHLEYLDKESFVPAAGQGILATEVRKGELSEIMKRIHSREAAMQLRAERDYLTILDGSCNAPCGAYCRREAGDLVMTAMYAQDGVHPVFCKGSVPDGGDLECASELAKKLAIQVRFQTVRLIGAGPGDAGLFTQKGLESVRSADVIVYDNLVSGSILNEARLDAELIYAGKRAGHHHMTQEQINDLLVKLALEGKSVVRLKGGDPYIFGRGGEEALALRKHGIPFEIVPGVSSSYSVPAYAGIPVTQRELASSFHVITGHEGSHKEEAVLDYDTLAKEEGTLVFLMGLQNLEHIAQKLIAGGKAKATPAAVISRGTTASQKKAVSDLEHIAEEVRRCGIRTPAITVIGPVVQLEKDLDWFGRGPLAGKRVMVTGTRYISRELEEELRPLGAEAVTISLIESRPVWNAQIREALAHIDRYQWQVFTSSNGVDLFFEMMKEQDLDLRMLMHMKFAAIGRKTAEALKEHGFSCDFVPENFSGADLAREWIPTLGPEERVLLLRAQEGSEVLPRELAKAGVPFADIPLYETWVDTRRKEELNRLVQEVDYVTLASSSAVRAFYEMLEDKDCLEAKVISIGPYTTKTAEELGLPVYADAVEYTAAGIAAVIQADVEELLNRKWEKEEHH